MNKRTSSLLGNIKDKGELLEKHQMVVYNSSFDYEKFEISDLKGELIKSEEKIFFNLEKIGKSTFEIAEELYKVNKKLANYSGGTYMAWCEAIGINKDKSSVLLKKYNLYLETNKKEAMELPVRIIKALTKKDNSFTSDEIVTIVEAEKPKQKLEEIENKYSDSANTKNYGITEAEIVKENIENKKIDKEDLLVKKEKLFQENKKINREIDKFNKEKMKKIEGNLDKISIIDQKLESIFN